jgi:hypothetical protein
MLFGSGVLVAILLSASGSHAPGAAREELGLGSAPVRPAVATAAPLPQIDLRLHMSEPKFDLRSLIPKKPPLEVKSMKVVGASGVGVFAPITDDVSLGVGVTAFKVAPHKRATQTVFGLRFKF